MGEIKGRLAYAAWAMLASWLGLDPAQDAVADQPGKILNVWPLPGGGPGTGEAFRILYRSTGINGEPIQVSGLPAVAVVAGGVSGGLEPPPPRLRLGESDPHEGEV